MSRFIAVVCAISTHCAIGGIYTFSLFTDAISRNIGVVGKTNQDWNVSSVIPVFSLAVCCAGLVAALTGAWAERVGPRLPIVLSGFFWGGGLMVTSLALQLHSLTLLYLGYGVLGGTGIGLAYAPPVAGLIRWYPTRKGFASGLAIMGFGGGALVASPLIRALMNANFVAPDSFGSCRLLALEQDGAGGQFLTSGTGRRVPVVIGSADLKSLGYSKEITALLQCADDSSPCCFKGDQGSTGAAATFLTLGVVYCIILVLAGLFFRTAPHNYKGDELNAPPNKADVAFNKPSSIALPPNTYVLADRAMRSVQFYRVWMNLFLNATAGIALLGVARNVIFDVYSVALPSTVDAAFCTSYVALLSLFNGLGRILWASVSDRFGRKHTFGAFFILGAITYSTIPFLAKQATWSLPVFVVWTVLAVTVYGGGFAISPAYLSDLFGSKQVGIIYSRLLTAWSAAGLCGPTLLAFLRRRAEVAAMVQLADQVTNVERFSKRFGVTPDKIHELIARNAVDIPSMMSVMESSSKTMDLTPSVYDSTMYVMALLLIGGFVNNWYVTQVPSELWTNDVELDRVGDVESHQQEDREERTGLLLLPTTTTTIASPVLEVGETGKLLVGTRII